MKGEQPICPGCGYPTNTGEHAPDCPVKQGGVIDDRESEQDSSQERKVAKSKSLIEKVGGTIDVKTNPYKHFDAKKHERFYIQKGRLNERDVVFKIGEQDNSDRLRDESRNLKVLERAEKEPGAQLDIHIVKQVSDLYQGEGMVGLATEFLEDDKTIKQELAGDEKVRIIGQVIENLQRLPVSKETLESSGLAVHNAEKIARDGQHFVQVLEGDGYLDAEIAGKLRSLMRSASKDLSDEQLVFVHGDAHGDNIFVQENEGNRLGILLLDIEGLRISNRYHDWSEILNKATLLQHLETSRPDLFAPIAENVKNMWLDGSVKFDEETIMRQVCGDDEQKIKNFRTTRIYDLLGRLMGARGDEQSFEQEARKIRKQIIEEQLAKLAT